MGRARWGAFATKVEQGERVSNGTVAEPAGYSVRRAMLEALRPWALQAGYGCPFALFLPWRQVPPALRGRTTTKPLLPWAQSCAEAMGDKLAGLETSQLFVRAQPLDESTSPHLSFAGVYASWAPHAELTALENLAHGIVKVLQGRFTRYADYYYRRHDLTGARDVDLMVSAKIPGAATYGTGFSDGARTVFEYYPSPIALAFKTPRRVGAAPQDALEVEIGRMVGGAARRLGQPVDVEFLIDEAGALHISQCRPISRPHLAAWEALAGGRAEGLQAPATIIPRRPARVTGRALRLDQRPAALATRTADDVLFVAHDLGFSPGGLGWLLEHLPATPNRRAAIVSLHARTVACDHLAYAAAEDPAVDELFHLTALRAPPDGAVIAVSGGGLAGCQVERLGH